MVKCEVIQDLLPLYQDNVASGASRALVEAHIEQCENCKSYLKVIQKESIPRQVDINPDEIQAFKKIKKKIRKKSFIIGFSSVIATLVFLYGVFFHQMAVPHAVEKITVNLAYDSVIDIFFDGNYSGVNARSTGDTLYIGYYGSLFTRLWQPNEQLQFSIGSNNAIDFGRNSVLMPMNQQINRIYYLDYSKINCLIDETDFAEAAEHAVLLWERQQENFE